MANEDREIKNGKDIDSPVESAKYEQYDKVESGRRYGNAFKFWSNIGDILLTPLRLFQALIHRIRFMILPKEYKERYIAQEEIAQRKYIARQKKENAYVANKKMQIIHKLDKVKAEITTTKDSLTEHNKKLSEVEKALKNNPDNKELLSEKTALTNKIADLNAKLEEQGNSLDATTAEVIKNLATLCHETGKEFMVVLQDGGALRFSNMEKDVEICYSNAPTVGKDKNGKDKEPSYLFSTAIGTASFSAAGEWRNGVIKDVNINNVMARIAQHGGINPEFDTLTSNIKVEQVNPYTGNRESVHQTIEPKAEDIGPHEVDVVDLTPEQRASIQPEQEFDVSYYQSPAKMGEEVHKVAIYQIEDNGYIAYGVIAAIDGDLVAKQQFNTLQEAQDYLMNSADLKDFDIDTMIRTDYSGQEYEECLKEHFGLNLSGKAGYEPTPDVFEEKYDPFEDHNKETDKSDEKEEPVSHEEGNNKGKDDKDKNLKEKDDANKDISKEDRDIDELFESEKSFVPEEVEEIEEFEAPDQELADIEEITEEKLSPVAEPEQKGSESPDIYIEKEELPIEKYAKQLETELKTRMEPDYKPPQNANKNKDGVEH